MNPDLIEEFLCYDAGTGVLTWKKAPGKKIAEGSIAGTLKPSGYIHIGLRGVYYKAHRLAWLLKTGELPPEFLDHKNGDRSDNRFENLRPATRQENSRNAAKRRNCSSPFKGVSWHKVTRKWLARAQVQGKQIHLGSFNEEVSAAKAYDDYVTRNFGEFAKPNVWR